MKAIFAACLLTVSATAVAETKRDIYDIMYLPNAGTAYGFTEANLIGGNFMSEDKVKTERDGYQFTQTLGYAFSNRFSLQADVNWLQTKVRTSGDPSFDQEGLSDPTVTARYRLIDEAHSLDLIADGLISTGDKETKSNGDEDNKQGGAVYKIGAQYGLKSENFQWAILAKYIRNMEATEDLSGVGKLDSNAHNAYQVRGDLLGKFSERNFARLFLGVDVTDGFGGDVSKTAPATAYTVGGEYQHLCTENFLFRAGLNVQEIYQDKADQNTNVKLLVGANYQF